jgi:hypothetical protein
MSYKKRKDPNSIKLNNNKINYNPFLKYFNISESDYKRLNEIFKPDLHKKLYKLGERYMSNRKLFPTIQKIGNHIIEHIVNHKDELYNFIESNKSIDYIKTKELFQEYIILPYLMTGNKHMNNYIEFSEFISKFTFTQGEDIDEVILFRCMDEDDYETLFNKKVNKSLSYTLDPSIPISYQYISTILDINKKNIIVGCVFKLSDLIIHIKDGKMSGENEVLVKINSKPIMTYKLGEYGKVELFKEFGEEILNFLPLTSVEIENGFNYIDCLISKGFQFNRIKKSTNQYSGSRSETHLNYQNEVSKFMNQINS